MPPALKNPEPIAQLVEHFPFKEGVVGSIPTRLTTFYISADI